MPAIPLLHPVASRLLPGRFLDQLHEARATYSTLSNDSILHGFRAQAGHSAPGHGMSGWCSENSSVIFGQLISGLARASVALRDPMLGEKATSLYTQWRSIAGPENATRLGTYGWDKVIGSMVDVALFLDYKEILRDLPIMIAHASGRFDRHRTPASAIDWDGRHPGGGLEWYTLGENLYRSYQITGDEDALSFAKVWDYSAYWDKFLNTAHPQDAHSVHAYSHVNSLCSLAAAYEQSGDGQQLETLKNAAEYVLSSQSYATGGYGPWERLVPAGGGLGEALDQCCDHAEVGCGSWAVFKLATYLLRFTGETRWAEWLEKVVYNLIGASLPVQPDGKTYYYADYRISAGFKLYFDSPWPCCSGTYLQAVSSYQDLIYFSQSDILHVALYLPSTVQHTVDGVAVGLKQETSYPLEDEIHFEVSCEKPVEFALRLRIPTWCREASLTGLGSNLAGKAGEWLEVRRLWQGTVKFALRLPQDFRLCPVDQAHPQRCAILRGPLVYAQNGRYFRPINLRTVDELRERVKKDERPGFYFVHDPVARDSEPGWIRPLFDFPGGYPYRVYHDLGRPYFYG